MNSGQSSVMSRQTSMPGAMAYSAPEVLTGEAEAIGLCLLGC